MPAFTWAVVSALAVLAGLAALGWRQWAPAAWNAPQWMLLMGAAGMLAGLWLDARDGGLARLAALCAAGPRELAATLTWHWAQLPMAHLGMLAGGLAVVPLMPRLRRPCRRQFCARLAQALLCSAGMLLGMAAAALSTLPLTAWSGSPGGLSALLGGMFAGMVWGMAGSLALSKRLGHERRRSGPDTAMSALKFPRSVPAGKDVGHLPIA